MTGNQEETDQPFSNVINAETQYIISPECPRCGEELHNSFHHIDTYTVDSGETHHVLNCNNCNTQLTQAVYHPNPSCIEIWTVTGEIQPD